MDQATFDRTFGDLWGERHAVNVTQSPRKRPDTINVVISLTNGTLPYWCEDIKDGSWGTDVSLSVYVKTPGLRGDEEQMLKRSDRFEMIAIPDVGRSEHAYVWHLARKASSFSGVEIFTKTNGKNCDARSLSDGHGPGRCDIGAMVKYMVSVARNGSYESVSYPWEHDRRYLMVRCNTAWRNHPLYHDLCELDKHSEKHYEDFHNMQPSQSIDGLIYTEKYKHGRVPLYVFGSQIDPSFAENWPAYHSFRLGPADLSFALRQLPQPLPFIHETYGEGMYAVRRDVLNQFSPNWYREWKRITYASAPRGNQSSGEWDKITGTVEGARVLMHHDRAMMEVFPLLFSQATVAQEFPAWHVSPSTMDLFDTVDAMRKFVPNPTQPEFRFVRR
jgi:hypothetical protein